MDLTLVGTVLAMGFGLGLTRPAVGVAVFVAIVAPLSSLPWQLGGTNLTLPTTYLFAFTVGFGALWIGDPKRRQQGTDRLRVLWPMSAAAGGLCVAVIASTVLSLARNDPTPLFALPSVFRAEAGRLVVFNPAGLAGKIQASWIALSGPLVFLATSMVFANERRRRLVGTSFLVGGLVATLTPPVQLAFLSPLVRPDRQGRSNGFVGFFQDPNSYATYLLIAMAVTTYLALRALARGHGAVGGLLTVAAAGSLASLFFSGSRGGLIIGCGVLASTIGMARLADRRAVDENEGGQDKSELKRPRGPGVIAALTALGFAGLILLGIGSQERVVDLVTRNRIVRTFEPGQPTPWRIERRLELWRAALGAAAERPVWGAGPMALATGVAPSGETPLPTPPDNAHNYYLQIGAEYGLPALALLLYVLAGATTRMFAGLSHLGAQSPLIWIIPAHLGVVAHCLISHPLLLGEIQGSYWVLLALGVSMASHPTGLGSPELRLGGQLGGRALE